MVRFTRSSRMALVLVPALVTFFAATVPASAAGTNVLANGDFEANGGSLTGWTKVASNLGLAADGDGGGSAALVSFKGTAKYGVTTSPQPVTGAPAGGVVRRHGEGAQRQSRQERVPDHPGVESRGHHRPVEPAVRRRDRDLGVAADGHADGALGGRRPRGEGPPAERRRRRQPRDRHAHAGQHRHDRPGRRAPVGAGRRRRSGEVGHRGRGLLDRVDRHGRDRRRGLLDHPQRRPVRHGERPGDDLHRHVGEPLDQLQLHGGGLRQPNASAPSAPATVTTPAAATATGADDLWHLDETSGTTMVDSGRTPHPGTVHNVALGQAGDPGFPGTSYGFDGASSFVSIPDAPDLNAVARDVHIAFSLKTSTVPAQPDYDLFRKGQYPGTEYKLELQPNGQLSCEFRTLQADGTIRGYTIQPAVALHDGRWHRLTCAKVGGKMTVTIDGTAFTKNITGSISNGYAMIIGAYSAKGGGDYFQGLLDEVSFRTG